MFRAGGWAKWKWYWAMATKVTAQSQKLLAQGHIFSCRFVALHANEKLKFPLQKL